MIDVEREATTEVIENLRSALKNIRKSAATGTLDANQVLAAIDDLGIDGDEEPAELAGERRGQEATASFYRTIVLESPPLIQDMPIPGEYRDVQVELADMFLEARGIRTELPAQDGGLPIPDLSPASEPITLEMAGGMPVPTDTLRHPAQLLQEPLQPSRPIAVRVNTKPSGEFAAGMPVPAF